MEDYKGYQGALRFISDISFDYDGCNTVDSLKSLVDEMRSEALEALKLGDEYNKTSIYEGVMQGLQEALERSSEK